MLAGEIASLNGGLFLPPTASSGLHQAYCVSIELLGDNPYQLEWVTHSLGTGLAGPQPS